MFNHLFIGDFLVFQLCEKVAKDINFNVDYRLDTNSVLLSSLTPDNIDIPQDTDYFWYCIGFGDLTTLDITEFNGFSNRVKIHINQLLEWERPIFFIIPCLPDYPIQNFDSNIYKNYLNKYNSILATYKEIQDEYSNTLLSFIDLNNIINKDNISFYKGLTKEGINILKDYFYRSNLL